MLCQEPRQRNVLFYSPEPLYCRSSNYYDQAWVLKRFTFLTVSPKNQSYKVLKAGTGVSVRFLGLFAFFPHCAYLMRITLELADEIVDGQ